MRVLSVSQVNFFLKSLIEGDGRLNDIYVSAEISNYTDHYRSGHLYFSLKDEKSIIKSVMFSNAARRLRFRPKDGMRVIVRGRVSVYEPSGQYQFYVEEMQPDGVGALSIAFEQLKEKLSKEGLFSDEHKKEMPQFPFRIGVITSPTGAAVQDMLNIISRRWPVATIVFKPTLVQGEDAPKQLIEALTEMNRKKCADVILIGRGGGSAEDLAAFNDEALARAVFASEIPVISAVGHETDFTICDFVADLRAPTPSAAAELAVPDILEVRMNLDTMSRRMQQAEKALINDCCQMLDSVLASKTLKQPTSMVYDRRAMLDSTVQRLKSAGQERLLGEKECLAQLSGKLEAMSPLKVLSRGYAMLRKDTGEPIATVGSVKVGDVLHAELSDGSMNLSVLECNLHGAEDA